MEKKWVIKDFKSRTYYCGEGYGWSTEVYLAEYFDTFEDAKNVLNNHPKGSYQIETVYIINGENGQT